MTKPLFRYHEEPEVLFMRLLNRANDTDLTLRDVRPGVPITLGRTLTKIPLAAMPSSPLRGRIDVHYQRIDLTNLLFGHPLIIEDENEVGREQIHQYLLEKWGVHLAQTDFTTVKRSYTVNYPVRHTVKVKETSLVWVGDLTVWSVKPGYLGSLFCNENHEICRGSERQSGFIYSIERNLSAIRPEQAELFAQGHRFRSVGIMVQLILNTLYELTGDRWVVEDSFQKWNLFDAQIIYHGLDREDSDEQVIVIKLSDYCTNLFGDLVISYNPA